MKEVINRFLVARGKFSAFKPDCGPSTKNNERIQYFTGDLRYIYQNELDKACFQHRIAYGDFKDLPRRTASDKVLLYGACNITKNPKYHKYQP